MNQKAVMGGGKALRTIVSISFAMVALATSAFAKIGETYQLVVAEAQQDRDTVSMQTGYVDGNRALDVKYRNGDFLRHVFGTNGREIAFYWWADHNVTSKEIGIVQRIFRTRWQLTQNDADGRVWQSDHLGMFVAGNYMMIVDLRSMHEIPTKDSKPAPTPAPRSAPVPSRSPNDCMIVATEAYNRLKPPVSHWANIAQVNVIENGKDIGGHAVLFYQPEAGGNVFMYDEDGTVDMFTQSHELSTLIESANKRFSLLNSPDRFRAIRWVVGSEATSTKSIDIAQSNRNYENWKNSQPKPTPSATPAATPERAGTSRVGYSNTYIDSTVRKQNAQVAYVLVLAGILAIFAIPVVICFLKGKPVFGSLGIVALLFGGSMSLWSIIGACRLAKPHSWWARRYYVRRPEKMQSALDRFHDLYKDSTRRAIEQSIKTKASLIWLKGALVAVTPAPAAVPPAAPVAPAPVFAAPVSASRYSGEVIDIA